MFKRMTMTDIRILIRYELNQSIIDRLRLPHTASKKCVLNESFCSKTLRLFFQYFVYMLNQKISYVLNYHVRRNLAEILISERTFQFSQFSETYPITLEAT